MRVYFSVTFLRSYYQAPPPVQQAFRNWLPGWMAQTNPWSHGRRFSGEYAAYYAWTITRNWDVIMHRHLDKDLVVFDVLMPRARVYALPTT